MKAKTTALHVSVLALCGLIVAPAHAQRERGEGVTWDDFSTSVERRFSALDADDDGQVSEQEYRDKRAEEFEKADRNGDGVIERGEMRGLELLDTTSDRKRKDLDQGRYSAKVNEAFAQFDDDHDGFITPVEFEAAWRRAFEMADRNDDETLRRGELRGFNPIEGR